MASAIRLISTHMEQMENSFLAIILESVSKIAELTQSKLFVVMETSNGLRRIGGNADLKQAFLSGTLSYRPSDVLIDEEGSASSCPSPKESLLKESSDKSRKRKSPECSDLSSSSKCSRPAPAPEATETPEVEFILEDVKLKNVEGRFLEDDSPTGSLDDEEGDSEDEAAEDEGDEERLLADSDEETGVLDELKGKKWKPFF